MCIGGLGGGGAGGTPTRTSHSRAVPGKDDREAVFYHAMPGTVYAECISGTGHKRWPIVSIPSPALAGERARTRIVMTGVLSSPMFWPVGRNSSGLFSCLCVCRFTFMFMFIGVLFFVCFWAGVPMLSPPPPDAVLRPALVSAIALYFRSDH